MSYAATVSHYAFKSPGDWDRDFWRVYHDEFLHYLKRACDPDGYLRFFFGPRQGT